MAPVHRAYRETTSNSGLDESHGNLKTRNIEINRGPLLLLRALFLLTVLVRGRGVITWSTCSSTSVLFD